MRLGKTGTGACLGAGLALLSASCSSVNGGPSAASSGAMASGTTPLMAQLARFSSASVPAMGPADTAVPARMWDKPIPAGLPGNGIAEHPMVLVGEGHNTIFVVDKGRIIWTYSTGPGWEYDDVWMLSNGNILFTRMQYVAEVTPEKKVVWRYDAPAGTEIHTAQPIGLNKVMFVLNAMITYSTVAVGSNVVSGITARVASRRTSRPSSRAVCR